MVELQRPRRQESAGLTGVSRVRFGDVLYPCATSMLHFHRTFLNPARPLSAIHRPPDFRSSVAGGTYPSFPSFHARAAGCVDVLSWITPIPSSIEERLAITKAKRQRLGRDTSTKARTRPLL